MEWVMEREAVQTENKCDERTVEAGEKTSRSEPWSHGVPASPLTQRDFIKRFSSHGRAMATKRVRKKISVKS